MANQSDVLGGILSILDRGGAQGTNKFALLLVLVDLAPVTEPGALITLDQLAIETLRLYWPMSLPFPDRAERLAHVRSPNRSLSAMSVLEELRLTQKVRQNTSWAAASTQFEKDGVMAAAVAKVGRELWRNPVGRLQRIPHSDVDFLFVRSSDPKGIRLLDDAHDALVRHGALLRELVQHRFVSFVSDIERNRLNRGPISVHDYLFRDDERRMPGQAVRNQLLSIQGGVSPYSGAPVSEKVDLDHVIPWARARVSMLENFVLVPAMENRAKSDCLLAPEALASWRSWHRRAEISIGDLAAKHGWPSDSAAHRLVCLSQYRAARAGEPIWGPDGVRSASERDIADYGKLLTAF